MGRGACRRTVKVTQTELVWGTRAQLDPLEGQGGEDCCQGSLLWTPSSLAFRLPLRVCFASGGQHLAPSLPAAASSSDLPYPTFQPELTFCIPAPQGPTELD